MIKSLNRQGFTNPSEIQLRAIPKALKGETLMVQSATGTGKTVMLGDIRNKISAMDGWIGVDINPETDLLDSLAREHKLPNACVVLNGVDMSKRKYGYYYGYGHYGKYGRYGYGKYGYGFGSYGYGNYASSHYGDKNDGSIKK